ncbi:MAG: hypothetical protein QG596_944 [Actinomycetota bacterium]|jgi:hypothetical protein|nr:hypothetical protein [Actinomycetota bacterium]
MAKVLFLALLSAVYPTFVALAILMLARPNPVKLFSGFLIGGMVVSIGAGISIILFADPASVGSGSSGATRPILSLVVGLALIAVATTLLLGRELPGAERRARRKARKKALAESGELKPSRVTRFIEKDSFWLAMGIGALLSIPSVWYLSALADLDAQGFSTILEIVIVILFNLIMFALIEFCLVFCFVAPERAAADVARFDSWTNSHMREIGIVVALGGGIYLAVKAVVTLI